MDFFLGTACIDFVTLDALLLVRAALRQLLRYLVSMMFFLEIRVAASMCQEHGSGGQQICKFQLQGWAGKVEGINNGALVVTQVPFPVLKNGAFVAKDLCPTCGYFDSLEHKLRSHTGLGLSEIQRTWDAPRVGKSSMSLRPGQF